MSAVPSGPLPSPAGPGVGVASEVPPGLSAAQWAAQCLLGLRGAPSEPEVGRAQLQVAIEQGDPWALQMGAALSLVGAGLPRDTARAFEWLSQAAATGDSLARQRQALVQAELGPALDLDAWLHARPVEPVHTQPRIGVVRGLIPAAWADWLVRLATPHLQAARIRDAGQGGARPHPMRTNTGMGLSVLEADPIVQLVRLRIAAVTALPLLHQEPSNVLHYAPGQEYRPHVDYLDPAVPHFRPELARFGQRSQTALVYLNEAYEGGETEFPRLAWRFKGRTGDALLFANVADDGVPLLDALHAGRPPSQGEKWLLSTWLRDRPYPLL